MKKSKTTIAAILTLAVLAGSQSPRVPLHGHWNPDNPPEFRADSGTLVLGEDYILQNNTTNPLSVMLWSSSQQGAAFFMVMNGDAQAFTAVGEELILNLRGSEGLNLNSKKGVVLRKD